MSSAQCQQCGSTDIDTDPSRGDSVCTQCGSVLEESGIISEVTFQQDSRGVSRSVGQLVHSEGTFLIGRKNGLNLGSRFGFGRESRAITLQNARRKIQDLCSKLNLNPRCVDTAFGFYKVALSRQLTRGRKSTHVVAACVYMVCRKEETPHMLLDLSDLLQVSVYELGKTYLKLSSALCINSPAIDPSLYILRFAHQLQFDKKTHEVAMTASRLVQRMKKDWMHTGRRPSGLCGAALLVAARLHNFNRTVEDVIKVVKVCQATVRKRLTEFSETPSSRLTLDEFMTIDLEEEQDPPAFKNARKKLHELEDEDQNAPRQEVPMSPSCNVDLLVASNTADSIREVVDPEVESDSGEIDLTGLDDDELDNYLMEPYEYERKDQFWHKYNADYLQEMKEREERRAKEEEENANKPDKKVRRSQKRGRIQASTAGEAIEKMLQQKKLSFKLNYDVLRNLNPEIGPVEPTTTEEAVVAENVVEEIVPPLRRKVKAKPKPRPTVPSNIRKGMSDIIGNTRKKEMMAAIAEENELMEEPPRKMIKLADIVKEEVSENVPLETIILDDVQNTEADEEIVEDDDEEEYESDDGEEKVPDYYECDEYVDDYDD
ncbi:transcription factor IIIB 90 kDa subunit-like [Uloborus diversus]|uniref:transcription factor IIIB 90 kDa subunit-like n=1 Tax=Uloborus diversus TaxID=327109 RepID=UPI002409E41A|nr:transcription factor IIIB 90 kDa subunit-like [Uloborus diversus]